MRLIFAILLLTTTCRAADYYVSPTGSGVVGSFESPMGLSNAIKSGVSPATAGDRIWVRGGTYPGTYNCNLYASSNNPIVIRNYNRERAIISLTNEFAVNGSGVWVWGLEFTDENTNRYEVRSTGLNLNTATVSTNGNKIINCIVHDVGNGLFDSYQGTNNEVYGSVFYNIGYQLEDRGHGHNLYVQNRSTTAAKTYSENIGLNVMNKGFNIRSSDITINMNFVGNVEVNAGALSTNGYTGAYHTEGETANNIVMNHNFTWFPSQQDGGEFFSFNATNGTLTLVSNVFVHSRTLCLWWTNLIYNYNIQSRALDVRPGNNPTNYTTADFNTYYNIISSAPVYFAGTNVTLAQWRGAPWGNDLNGTATASGPSGTWTYVRPNAYESGRANIIIYNWSTNGIVSVDISGVVPVGKHFQVRNAANYYGPILTNGIYAGGVITLPMTNLSVATPVGIAAAPATDARFNVFVLESFAVGAFVGGSGTITISGSGSLSIR